MRNAESRDMNHETRAATLCPPVSRTKGCKSSLNEVTFAQNGLHLQIALGAVEKRSKSYIEYDARASQTATPRYRKILGGSWAPPASRARGCKSL